MVLDKAYVDATAHRPYDLVGTQTLRYTQLHTDVVDLKLTPTEELTWEVWIFALLGIETFFEKWEYVALSFDVLGSEVGRVGTGMVF